jgi:peptidyl-tRNA hydrolase, PTH1 family
MKYLIVGLGNIGDGYADTRHNIGFTVLDAMAKESNTSFIDKRYGAICQVKIKGRTLILLKPSTFMNLSGNAVRYWLKKENIPLENLLVIVDDIALPAGSTRLRSKGGPGSHNGLAHIGEILSSNDYARIRIGIGNNFRKGDQINYVLGTWTDEEKDFLTPRISIVIKMIESFCTSGVELTMTAFNKAGNISGNEKAEPEDPGKSRQKSI